MSWVILQWGRFASLRLSEQAGLGRAPDEAPFSLIREMRHRTGFDASIATQQLPDAPRRHQPSQGHIHQKSFVLRLTCKWTVESQAERLPGPSPSFLQAKPALIDGRTGTDPVSLLMTTALGIIGRPWIY